MDILQLLMQGFAVALTPENIMYALIGAFLGTLIGCLPGLGPANGIAILMPLCFSLGLGADSALIMLTSVYAGTMYGGRISSILLNIPGDEPAMMTCLDGYPMARKGKAAEALALSAIASFIGSFLAVIGLIIMAPLLARFALHFGPAEYFALFILAFATLGGITGKNPMKTVLATALGLMLSTIGVDMNTGVERFTYGNLHLYEGIEFIVIIVGLFAVSELFIFVESHAREGRDMVKVAKLKLTARDIFFVLPTALRGSLLGFIAGVLPGAGASLGSFISYTLEKKVQGKKGHFGEGDPRGVAAPEAGNNAAANGALVPMLTLGVPGSGTTAVLLAMLVTLNIQPGPLMFQQHADVVWGVIAALLFGNILLLFMNIPMIGLFVKILSVPSKYLMPMVTMVAVVGIYSISNSTTELYMMIGFGVLGYVLRKLDIPLVPIVLGTLLGPTMEVNLRNAMSLSGGDVGILWNSGIAITIWSIAIIGLLAPVVVGPLLRRKMKAAHEVVE
ncbi:tripartite tricarboxylate transporter TctA [Zobellella taiwanensis]|uniref:Tripartite tricarboxylate transporter TctA n=1 Tax=Zobellella taiwanensis TaxID=347535 RepID=A0A2P7RAL6_9GAMM|nr:tripartite tricarboxylate transporter permease [Zobellella taiwanensis]PSJ47212.1 tripartite tricarboxylate transporter TctA [Zobellella taiwanensis]